MNPRRSSALLCQTNTGWTSTEREENTAMKFITHSLTIPLGRWLALVAALLALSVSARAQNLVFSEDWEIDHSLDNSYVTNYTLNNGPAPPAGTAPGGANLPHLYFD